MIKDNLNIILGLVSTIVTGLIGWYLGGKQQTKNSTLKATTSADGTVVDTTRELINLMKEMLAAETERKELEIQHKENCEKDLKEHKKLLDGLRKEVNQLKRKS